MQVFYFILLVRRALVKVFKIGQYLAKIWTKVWWQFCGSRCRLYCSRKKTWSKQCLLVAT